MLESYIKSCSTGPGRDKYFEKKIKGVQKETHIYGNLAGDTGGITTLKTEGELTVSGSATAYCRVASGKQRHCSGLQFPHLQGRCANRKEFINNAN